MLEETARREAREETGIDLDDEIIYLESKSFVAGNVQPVVDIVFLARYRSGAPPPATAAEIAAHPGAASWTLDSITLTGQHRKTMDR
jgi:8-oxo-dGTP diphosphatase